MDEVKFSLVLPAYNEEDELVDAVVAYLMELEDLFNQDDFEVIIVEGGCDDLTRERSSFLSNKLDNVKHLHFEKRQGRGIALKKAFKIASGNYLAYSDVDLYENTENLRRAILKSLQGNSLVIGSRVIEDSNFERNMGRSFLSKCYNRLVRLVLGSNVSDHQCGLKIFNREEFEKIIENVKSKHWTWDTEILYEAQENELNIKEVPIKGKENDDSTVKALDPILMALNVISIRFLR